MHSLLAGFPGVGKSDKTGTGPIFLLLKAILYVITSLSLLFSLRVISTLSRADHSAYIRYVIMLSNSLFDRESVNAYIIYVIMQF